MASSRRTGTNENISTYGTAGRDYSSLTVWEQATDNDLVTATTSEVLECYDDAVFTDNLTAAGATTDATYFRIIRPAPGEGHNGTPTTGVRFTSTTAGFIIAEANFQTQDLVLTFTGNSASGLSAYSTNSNPANAVAVGCIAKCTNAGAGVGRGFHVVTTGSGCGTVNCLAYECKSYGYFFDGSGAKTILNCTAIDAGITGFHRQLGNTTAKNCLGHGSGTSDFAGTLTNATTNASEDATASGTGARTSQTFTFVDSANDDWHLLYTDVGALGHGTSMTAEGTYAFDDDVDAEVVADWSIGFDSDAPVPASGGGGGFNFKRRRR